MKADTFAKLVVLETLIDAEVGYLLEHRPQSMELFREGLVARVSDLVDEIDALDAVAAARAYDAIVDFLAELPEDDAGVVDATLRFRRAIDRTALRGMDQRDRRQSSTWAMALDALLEELADEYHAAIRPSGEILEKEYLRAQTLLARAREAADRMLWEAGDAEDVELRSDMDRLTFAIRHQRLKPTAVDFLIRAPQRRAARYRPSTLTRIGSFVLGQVLRREGGRPSSGGESHPSQGDGWGARVLVSLRRRVAAVRQGDYHGLWSELRDSAEAAGAHAWRFSASGDAALFLEFLEFGAGADPRSQPRVRELLARLESEAGVAVAEEWRELPE